VSADAHPTEPPVVELHGEHWLPTLLDVLPRGGVGQLERRADGIVFVFADRLPTPEKAWERAGYAAPA
jgi:hypothetical protein